MTTALATSLPQDPVATALLALRCLDLTSLNEPDTESDIARLCARAHGPMGSVAAVCVWPRLAAFARSQLPDFIAVAAVANFPDGGADIERALRDTNQIVQSGAQEVDVVLPYQQLIAGDVAQVASLLQSIRKASGPLVLKVILETGQLQTADLIKTACRISLDAGADFLKTSTGKTPTSATPAAATVMLQAIAGHATASRHVGFKASGGIKTVADAALYMQLTREHLGTDALTSARFRIGASGILNDIEAILGGRETQTIRATGGY